QDYNLSPYYVDKTDNNGWRLYRIPLEDVPDSSKVGVPFWDHIRYARLWLTSPESTSTMVQIASIQLVGNRWQSSGVELMNESSNFDPVDTTQESFNIFVINTYENGGYEPPAGVAGVLDRNTGVREREQSLVLRYKDLKRGHSGMAYRIHRGEDYTNYQKLKMFVHGNIEDSCVTFFYRMGTDTKNYYEYHTELYEGWDPRNEVNIDFSQITALKNYMLMNPPKDSTGYRDTTAGNYRVVGNPTLSSVSWFAMGVYSDTLKQDSSGVVSGEIWVDELRIVDVRKVPGWFYTGTVTTKFADLVSLDFNFSRKDSEFRGLNESEGSGTNSTSLGLRSGISLEKFIPPSWGFSLPFSFNWSKTLDLPRLKSGSDIVLPKELRRSERTEITTKSFSFSPKFIRETNNWLLKLTLKRLTLSENLYYSRTDSRRPTVPISRTENYGFGLKYDVNPKINLTLSPFKGLKSVFILKKLSSETISFLPNKLVFTSSIKGAKSFSQSNVGNITSDYTRDFRGWIESSMTPLKTVQLDYKFETSRDIRNDNDIKFSLLPKKAKLGIELNRSQNFTANYRPKWVGILDQSFSFSSFYKENADPKLYHGSRVVGNQAARNANFTFYWQRVFGILKPKPKEEKEGKGINPFEMVRGFVGNLSQNLSALSINYRITKTSSKSGLLARPSLSYQFGFTHKIDVPLTTGTETSSNGLNTQKSLDLSSSLRISPDINISSFRYSRAVTNTLSSGQPTKNISKIFPDLSVTWGSLEKIKLLKRFASSAYYSFGYRKKVDETRDGVQYKLNKRDISTSFSPMFSLNMTLKNGVQTSWKWDKQKTESQNIAQQNTGISTSNSYSVSAAYSFSAPKGIKLPFLKKIKFHSNLAIGLDISIKRDQSKSSVSGNKFVVTGDSKSFSVVPRASYSFSSQVRGGLSARWIDTKNNITGEKNHTRELSIWVEFVF
ncbi:MAG: cell surface protein SprA, partial [candidate division Zixibacteria bacterium]|nr:cell surface protein SprA [candidate division Zixibacteria bacterium]